MSIILRARLLALFVGFMIMHDICKIIIFKQPLSEPEKYENVFSCNIKLFNTHSL
jgi:hypothetical protein